MTTIPVGNEESIDVMLKLAMVVCRKTAPTIINIHASMKNKILKPIIAPLSDLMLDLT